MVIEPALTAKGSRVPDNLSARLLGNRSFTPRDDEALGHRPDSLRVIRHSSRQEYREPTAYLNHVLRDERDDMRIVPVPFVAEEHTELSSASSAPIDDLRLPLAAVLTPLGIVEEHDPSRARTVAPRLPYNCRGRNSGQQRDDERPLSQIHESQIIGGTIHV